MKFTFCNKSFGSVLQPEPKLLLIFAFLIFFVPPPLLAKNCPSDKIDKTGRVTHVYDGDTLKLQSGEKIRLIGINTPEMNYDKGSPEPFALQAKNTLTSLALNKTVKLRYGRDKHDKYNRTLAHVFLADGTNLQSELIRKGLAFHIAIPPNLWQLRCYQALEKTAMHRKLAIWNHKRFKAVDASKVNRKTLGFYRVTGKIERVGESKKFIWLNLNNKMALRISKNDKHHFASLDKNYWEGKTVTAKGWINNRKKKFSMRLKHEAAVTFH